MIMGVNSFCSLMSKTVRILVSNTRIEYFMSVFHHGYCSELVLSSPEEDFARTLILHTRLEYLRSVFQPDYGCTLIL